MNLSIHSQVSISVQWLSVVPAAVALVPSSITTTGVTTVPMCVAPYRHILLSLIYVMTLMMAVAALAIKVRYLGNCKRERKLAEARYLVHILSLVLYNG